LRTLAGSILRRFNPAELGYWLTGPFWRKQAPFDVFDHWMDIAEKKGLYWHFNFLGGRAAAPDCEYDLEAPFVRRLLQHLPNTDTLAVCGAIHWVVQQTTANGWSGGASASAPTSCCLEYHDLRISADYCDSFGSSDHGRRRIW
jgi:hypothetical protein